MYFNHVGVAVPKPPQCPTFGPPSAPLRHNLSGDPGNVRQPPRSAIPSLFPPIFAGKLARGKKKPSPPARRRRQAQSTAAPRRVGKTSLCAKPPGDPRRAVDVQLSLLPVGELLAALHVAKIRFLIVGGTGAVLHGVPMATVDVDIWVDLGKRDTSAFSRLPGNWGRRFSAATSSVCATTSASISSTSFQG